MKRYALLALEAGPKKKAVIVVFQSIGLSQAKKLKKPILKQQERKGLLLDEDSAAVIAFPQRSSQQAVLNAFKAGHNRTVAMAVIAERRRRDSTSGL